MAVHMYSYQLHGQGLVCCGGEGLFGLSSHCCSGVTPPLPPLLIWLMLPRLVLSRQVIVADTFTNLSAQYLGPDALPAQRPFVLLVVGVLVLLMCFPRNLQALGEPLWLAVAAAQHVQARRAYA